ncbi:MAG: serine/threonine protein kinase [Planctomycetes bacterium]|nr:serine/threonine protein kinase [Planctomycetota bacterium]
MSIDIPNYRAIEKLGEGAQTRIFRARCMRTGKDYAVKVVKVVKPEDMSFVDLLRAEYAIGSSVDHPVIRKVYELRIMRQRLRVRGAILFMEYVPGVSMSDREFSRSLDELLGLMRQAAEGLHAMHLAGWVHADIKPNNILVTPDNLVKLIDLGQSSRMREAKTRVQGTIDYMAPEQAQRGVLDQRTDVFGVGAALHRVVVGRPVLTEMNQTVSLHSQSLVGKRLEEVRKPMLDVLPTCVARLIDDCCKADPHDRISDMPALVERIELARAILSKHAAAVPDAPPPLGLEDDDSAEDALGDAIFEQLGIPADGDSSVDIEDFGDLREE